MIKRLGRQKFHCMNPRLSRTYLIYHVNKGPRIVIPEAKDLHCKNTTNEIQLPKSTEIQSIYVAFHISAHVQLTTRTEIFRSFQLFSDLTCNFSQNSLNLTRCIFTGERLSLAPSHMRVVMIREENSSGVNSDDVATSGCISHCPQ